MSARAQAAVAPGEVPDGGEADDCGGRHVLFMSRYSTLRGGPLFALFDQLVARSCEGAGEPVRRTLPRSSFVFYDCLSDFFKKNIKMRV